MRNNSIMYKVVLEGICCIMMNQFRRRVLQIIAFALTKILHSGINNKMELDSLK